MRHILSSAVLCLAFLGLVLAQVEEPARTESPQDFVFKASAAGLAEVNLGGQGAKSASDAEVKKFAEKMVEDHTKANKELLALADKKRWTAAPRMDPRHEQLSAALGRLSGPAFDREFMTAMVKDHQEAVGLFERQSKEGKDEDLKGWAEKTLPTLREHLKMAEDLHGRFKDTSAAKDDKDRKDTVKDSVKDRKDTVKDDKDRRDTVKDTAKDRKDTVKDTFKDDKDRKDTVKDRKDVLKDDKDRKDVLKDIKDRKDVLKDTTDAVKDRKDAKERPIEKDKDRPLEKDKDR